MPPKVQITREMIIEAGLEIVRAEGYESLNLRRIAEFLGCSTRPMTCRFKNTEELKKAVYERADKLHTEYIMNIDPEKGVMLSIGLNYIRFGAKETEMFRFLFQSGMANGGSLLEMINSEELVPVLSAMSKAMETTSEQTKKIFTTVAMFAHGYASIIANNSLEYDEKTVAADLERAYRGTILAAREEEFES